MDGARRSTGLDSQRSSTATERIKAEPYEGPYTNDAEERDIE